MIGVLQQINSFIYFGQYTYNMGNINYLNVTNCKSAQNNRNGKPDLQTIISL
jgi:hypothetical protein